MTKREAPARAANNMYRKTTQKDSAMPLMQKKEDREAMLSRMRDKLAAPSQAVSTKQARRVARKRLSVWTWASRVAVVGSIIAANAFLYGFRDEIIEQVKPRHAPALPKLSASLTKDKQALFWTYALFDFDKLKQTFGAPRGAVVDAGAARRHLSELRPQVSPGTRLVIDSYLPRGARL